jgi:hypothetical protein
VNALSFDDACSRLAARLREMGGRKAVVEVLADGRVEVWMTNGEGFVLESVRADVMPDGTDVAPSIALRAISASVRAQA